MFGLHLLARSVHPPIITPEQHNRIRNRYNVRVVSTMSKRLPFIAVEYRERRVAIQRDADYDTTISLVTDAFPMLAFVPVSSIVFTVTLAEFDMLPVEIGRSVWRAAVPELSTIQVLQLNFESGGSPSKKRNSAMAISSDLSTNANHGVNIVWD